MKSSAFDSVREPANRLVAEIEEMEDLISRLLKVNSSLKEREIRNTIVYLIYIRKTLCFRSS